MPLVLFTDFGATDLYVGQVKAMLSAHAPRVPVIDALHDAPAFGIRPSAHLLAALAPQFPRGSVFLAVVDPGVGGARDEIVVEADGRTFVGPDNGLFSVLWRRAARPRCRRIVWRPESLSPTFHGRDLFAPVAARIAAGRAPRAWFAAKPKPAVLLDARALGEVIYLDHYGNAMTGLPGRGIAREARLRARGRLLRHALTFEEVARDAAFWHVNSLGLLEISAREASAARNLGLRVGTPVAVSSPLRRRRSRGSR